MEKICLDLEVILDFLRGDKLIVEKIRNYSDREEICITSHTLFYLLIGVRKPDSILPFVNSISVLEFDRKAAALAAKLIHDNRERGKSMGMDELITASICLSTGSFLFTKNRKEFEHIKNLKLV
jgi:predicted nucleic acid-binding protein